MLVNHRNKFVKFATVIRSIGDAVKLYGSRAKGTFHERSDVDLVLIGTGIDRFLVADILLDLADTDLPYTVDLQNYSEIKNRALVEHIDRVGMVIYER